MVDPNRKHINLTKTTTEIQIFTKVKRVCKIFYDSITILVPCLMPPKISQVSGTKLIETNKASAPSCIHSSHLICAWTIMSTKYSNYYHHQWCILLTSPIYIYIYLHFHSLHHSSPPINASRYQLIPIFHQFTIFNTDGNHYPILTQPNNDMVYEIYDKVQFSSYFLFVVKINYIEVINIEPSS